ncbi:MAG: hypothetical protein FJ088_01460, partial [Deltaproteobacteria bacterium]|nr:hypothetical protein [Deltaproteobacteria bacterium]
MSDLPSVIKEFSRLESSSKKICSTLKKIEALKNDLRANCFHIEQELNGLRKAAAEIPAGDGLKKGLDEVIAGLDAESGAKIQEIKGEIGAELLKVIEPFGLTLSGNLPELQCGFLALKFDFNRGGEVRITFGREREELAKIKLDIITLGSEIASLYKELLPEGFSDADFLKSLYNAYEVSCFRLRKSAGESVPLVGVLREVSFERQKKAFQNNPKRENFSSYGRVQFAVDISRLKTARFDDMEMRLTVATME